MENNRRGLSFLSVVFLVPLLTIATIVGMNFLATTSFLDNYPKIEKALFPDKVEVIVESPQSSEVQTIEKASVIENNWSNALEKAESTVIEVFFNEGDGQGKAGTGFRISENFIVTNWHILSEASLGDTVEIIVDNSLFVEGTYLGRDESNDLAIIEIEENLPEVGIATLGDSATLKIGEPILVLGNPNGLHKTATTGIVSFIGRPSIVNNEEVEGKFDDESKVINALQLDVNSNSGSSGSPVLNLQGEVVGIVYSNDGGVDGTTNVTFAIPINTLKQELNSLVNEGTYHHSILGVKANTVRNKEKGGFKTVQIIEIREDSVASRSGLQEFDLITKINDIPIDSAKHLFSTISVISPGETAVFTIVRGDDVIELPVSF